MALGNRYKTAPGAGTLTALILVLVFGSPWYLDWATKNADSGSAGDWWLRLLAWPHWEFNSHDTLRNVLVGDLKAILVVVLTLLFLFLLPGSQLARARGTISQFFAGWGAYIFAGAFAAMLTTFFLANPSLVNAFQSATSGAAYGFFTGWIVGLATLGGRRGTR
jgi:hypothetical protein